MKRFSADVDIIEKRRIRIHWDSKKVPTKKQMLDLIEEQNYEDVSDEETLQTFSVEKINVIHTEDVPEFDKDSEEE